MSIQRFRTNALKLAIHLFQEFMARIHGLHWDGHENMHFFIIVQYKCIAKVKKNQFYKQFIYPSLAPYSFSTSITFLRRESAASFNAV